MIVGGRAAAVAARLFNCAVVIHRGRVLGVVPKSYLPNYREYYEKRQFRAARECARRQRSSCSGETVPFGADLVFRAARPARLRRSTSRSARTCGCRCRRAPTARWPARPCSRTSRRATSPSARPTTGARCARRSPRARSRPTSTRPRARGESTTDLAWDGQALICENGDLLAEAERFCDDEQLAARRRRPRTDRLRPREHEQLRRLDPRPPRRRSSASGTSTSSSAPARARRRCGAAIERFPFVPGRPREPRRALLRGLQHPGPRAWRSACARPGSRRS